jgi:peptidoglycan-associated lipoprotein
MIKNTLLVTLTLSALMFSGCSQKKPNMPENGMNNIADATQIAGETVAINENSYNDDASTLANNMKNKNNVNDGQFNSSSDGFQSIYFGFGGYGIASGMENSISTNVQLVNRSNAKIKIEGNCDEFGTDEYNYALGLKRAKSVKDSIVAQGVSASKMVIISFGESNPVCSNPTDSCYAQNRRVDLRLVK